MQKKKGTKKKTVANKGNVSKSERKDPWLSWNMRCGQKSRSLKNPHFLHSAQVHLQFFSAKPSTTQIMFRLLLEGGLQQSWQKVMNGLNANDE